MAPPTQWESVICIGIGGVLAVGVPDERRVVVGSHSGVGVFDTRAGERIARVVDNDYAWLDEQRLTIRVPTRAGVVEEIPSMGLHGGTLPSATADGWECERTDDGVTLERGAESVAVPDDEEFRACGFSPGGSVFVLATSPNLTVLRRPI